jgi:hypothetical protein
MSLVLPSEIVVERFVPTARVLLASELDERGFTQQEIADRLGVTQAAISNLVNENVAIEPRFSEDERMIATVERIAEGFDSGEMDEVDALAELLALIREFEDRGPICAVHEELMPELEGLGCDLCVRGTDSQVLAERDVLRSVRRAARLLTGTDAVTEYVPNVGTNIGMALPDAEGPTDVAAIPGRIYRIRGTVERAANPEFGASEHVAGTVLVAKEADDDLSAALNLATSDALLDAARDAGIDPLEFDAGYEGREEHLRERLAERESVPRVLYHRGEFGIEPVTYVLGETAVDAAELAVDLVESAMDGRNRES